MERESAENTVKKLEEIFHSNWLSTDECGTLVKMAEKISENESGQIRLEIPQQQGMKTILVFDKNGLKRVGAGKRVEEGEDTIEMVGSLAFDIKEFNRVFSSETGEIAVTFAFSTRLESKVSALVIFKSGSFDYMRGIDNPGHRRGRGFRKKTN